MEIESESLVINEADSKALETLSQIGEYSLSVASEQLIEDTFLDTKKLTLMAKGFYLRLRKEVGKDEHWLTIKSLNESKNESQARDEYSCFLPAGTSVSECPDARIRNMILELSPGFDLLPFLRLERKRIVRQVRLGEKQIAELSLDRVNIKGEAEEKIFSELEIILKIDGTQQDLQTILEYLLENYNLVKDPFSKFERALLFRENLSERTLLSCRERAVCMQLAAQGNLYGKQARILLSLNKGMNTAELSLLLKIPEPEIEALYLRFEKEKLSIFPFSSGKKRSREFYFQAGSSLPGTKSENLGSKKWTIEELLDFYGVDRERAEQIRTNVLIVFDGLLPYHGLVQEEREMLGIAALLQDIGSSVSPAEKARMGKEILLTHPLEGLKLHEIRILALIIELLSPSILEKELSAVLEGSGFNLSPEDENKALLLAAFLRFVDLPGTGALMFLPGRIRQVEGAVEIEVFGQHAGKAAKKAEQKSELWTYLYGTKLHFKPGKDLNETEIIQSKAEITGENNKEKRNLKLVVNPENPMALVAWRVFSQQFARMLSLEKATRKGDDIEALHDMRVAVRRLRAAAKVFEAYLDPEKLEPQINGLRRTLGALGNVRDLDVFREKAEEYSKKLSSEDKHDLDPLFEVLAREKEKALGSMLAYLDSEKYARFKKEFSDFLSVPEAWAQPAISRKHDALPHRVRDVLPSILYARFSDISTYSEWVEGSHVSLERLHRLRIAAKGMRYTLEFFEGMLGEDTKILIGELKNFQDHLGNLHDAIVAIDLLSSFLETGEWGSVENREIPGKKGLSGNLREIEGYLKFKEEELQVLLNTFPETWGRIRSEEFCERIENIVKRLYTGYFEFPAQNEQVS